MASEEYLNSENFELLEQFLYNGLKELKTANTKLNQKFNKLKNLYFQYSSLSEDIRYHDQHRFGFLKSITDSSKYRILQRAKIQQLQKEKQVNIIDEMYDLVMSIVDDLTQKEQPVNYAIYFTGKDGKIYRTQQDKISLDYLNISQSNQSMRLSASAFKKFALEQQGTVDVTEHYAVFMGVLQDTYNGQKKLPNSKINAGRIAEAFERHLQNVHAAALNGKGDISLEANYDWTVDEAWRLIRQSLGNDPWYTGGDVGRTQVKNIGKGNVRITNFNTIEDIINFLLYLGENKYDEETLRLQSRAAARVLYNKSNDVIEEGNQMVIDEFLNEINKR